MTGFDPREIEALLVGPNDAEDDAPPLPDNPVSKPADLWLLGDHRLQCGDSTKAEDVARLMNGQKARLFACDPPYLINYKGGNHPQSWANSPDTKDKHWDDYQDPAKAVEFYVDYLRIGLAHCIDRVPVYQWHGDLRRVIVAEAWECAGLLLHQIIVWVKARPVLTRSHFMWQHEVCAYGWRSGKMPSKPPANSHSVWTIDQIGESDGIHPTQKPVELARRPILYQTQPGDICYEPFSGSGTTIAAAELTGRRCYAMEISPAFVDVAVLRWQVLTNQTARLDTDGRTFDQAAERMAVAESNDVAARSRRSRGGAQIRGPGTRISKAVSRVRGLEHGTARDSSKGRGVMARPEAKIDLVELEKLCNMQCTDEEVAAFFGVNKRTIMRRRKVAKFRDIMDRAKAKGRISVRRHLFRLAGKDNVAAAIFLSKNLLGYRDVVNTEHTGLDGGPIQIATKPDLTQLSDEELEQLRIIAGKTKPPGRD